MTAQCAVVRRGDNWYCSLHDKPLTHVDLTENTESTPDTKAFICSISGVTLLVNVEFTPDLY